MKVIVLISVIVPIYKVEQYLPQCIDSIINQTYRNIEIILVDDGSPDHSGSICEEYAKRDSRLRVFHKKNGGLSDARNYGIKRAAGEYIGFVDSDDWLEPDMYELLVNLAEEERADIINCGYYFEYPQKKLAVNSIDRIFDNPVDLCKALVYDEINTGVVFKLYHKSCFLDVAFPNGRVFEDTATMYKLFLNAKKAVSISKPLYHYRKEREGSITQTRSMDNLIDCWRAHKARYDFFAQDSRFNTDKVFMDKLLYFCAFSIARAWRWCYSNTEQEREQYASFFEEMRLFCKQKFPVLGMKNWPLHMRVVICVGQFNNKFSFAFLYFMLQVYRLISKNVQRR